MKKTLFCFVWWAVSCLPTYAQNDIKAQTILFTGYQKYKTFQNIKMDFAHKSVNEALKLDQQYTGTGYVQGNKHRIMYAEYEVLTDGTNIWTYYKQRKNVNITLYDPKDGMLTPEEIFREDFLQSGLTYKYIGENTDEVKAGSAKPADIIEFFPKDGKRTYTKFRIWINKETNLMDKWVTWLRNGTVTTYTITITPNVKLEPKFFDFDTSKLPKDVKITDRRK
jgi:outer membrane lipoprotein-sorting protein